MHLFWHDYEWLVILGMGLIGMVLGYIGFARYAAATGRLLTPLDLFYLNLQLLTLESGAISGPVNWQLQIARFLVPALAAYAAAKAATIIFREQIQMVRLWYIQDHIIICGLGQKGFLLVDQFQERGERIVVIEHDEDNNLLALCQERGAIVLIGDATDDALLRKAAVLRAKHLISVCDDDGTNAEVAVQAQEITQDRQKGVLSCIIHIVDPQIWDLLREQELGTDQFTSFRFQLFNIFDRAARLLVQEYLFFEKDNETPHILIIGLGNLGTNLVIQIARTWQELQPEQPEQQLQISVIDRKADWKVESLYVRYPALTNICKLQPLQMDINSPDFHRAEFLYDDQDQGQCDVDVIYICLDDDTLGLHTGLALLRQVKQYTPPIVLRMAEHTGLATLLYNGQENNNTGAFENLHSFELLSHTCTPDLVLGGTSEILARTLHEDYVKQQQLAGQTMQTNPAIAPWDKLPEHLKESNRRQVDHIRQKFEAVGVGIMSSINWNSQPFTFTPEEIEFMARMEHERWVDERIGDGWKYAAGAKNIKKKTHPDLVPWDKLPVSAKDWNRNAVQELPTFLAQAGFQIYNLEK